MNESRQAALAAFTAQTHECQFAHGTGHRHPRARSASVRAEIEREDERR